MDGQGGDRELRSRRDRKRRRELGMRWGIYFHYFFSSCCRCCRASFPVDRQIQARPLRLHRRGSLRVNTNRKAPSGSTITSHPRHVQSMVATRETKDGKRWISKSSHRTYIRSTYGATTSSIHKARRCRMRKDGSSLMRRLWHKRETCLCRTAIS